MCLDLVFVSIFDFLCGNVPIGSGCLGLRVELQTLKTNSASGEKSEEEVFDARSEGLLLGEQKPVVSSAGALLSLHRGTCAREGAGS